jgi:acyl-CoA synthetase (AMP-forming)/AMP-acid ligase II
LLFDFNTYYYRIAIITDDGTCLTYEELANRVQERAQSLRKGVLEFCLCRNDVDSIVHYLACLEAQAPVLLLDAQKDEATIEYLQSIYQPGITQCHPDLALCLTTSGSTGSPKLVRLTRENLLSNARSIADYLHIDENERPITMLPMYYSFGLSIINSHLLCGATILLTDKTYAQREFWNFLRENEATSMAGVPYTWEMLRRLRFFRMDLPSVKTMTQAGGKLNTEIAREYIENAQQTGRQFVVMYGQTEATARMSYLPWEHAAEKAGSVGIAIPGGRFEVVDADGKIIQTPNEDGELIYYGDNVSMGYAECAEDLLRGDDNHGRLATGDIARRDEDGFYYITGRKKRFVKIWGNRCNLDQIEQLAKTVTTSCACVGVDDQVTIFTTARGVEQDIKQLLTTKTGLNSRAFSVREIDAIPVSESGKLDYRAMQDML